MELIDKHSRLIGASPSTCRMGGADYPYDNRPYSQALQQTGYGLGSVSLLRDAIAHQSTPMLGAWLASVGKGEGLTVLPFLHPSDLLIGYRLWMMGEGSDIGEMFQGWELADWDDAIARSIGLRVYLWSLLKGI